MNPTVVITLGPTDFEALDNSLRAHRSTALLVPGAPLPMDAFQIDLVDTARRLGFVPPEPGSFWVNIQPGGRNRLCWEASNEKSLVARTESGPTLH